MLLLLTVRLKKRGSRRKIPILYLGISWPSLPSYLVWTAEKKDWRHKDKKIWRTFSSQNSS